MPIAGPESFLIKPKTLNLSFSSISFRAIIENNLSRGLCAAD